MTTPFGASLALQPAVKSNSLVKAAVLHGFSNVLGGNGFGVPRIGYSARHFQNAIVRAGEDAHLPHGHFESPLAVVQSALLADRLPEAAAYAERAYAKARLFKFELAIDQSLLALGRTYTVMHKLDRAAAVLAEVEPG